MYAVIVLNKNVNAHDVLLTGKNLMH